MSSGSPGNSQGASRARAVMPSRISAPSTAAGLRSSAFSATKRRGPPASKAESGAAAGAAGDGGDGGTSATWAVTPVLTERGTDDTLGISEKQFQGLSKAAGRPQRTRMRG